MLVFPQILSNTDIYWRILICSYLSKDINVSHQPEVDARLITKTDLNKLQKIPDEQQTRLSFDINAACVCPDGS